MSKVYALLQKYLPEDGLNNWYAEGPCGPDDSNLEEFFVSYPELFAEFEKLVETAAGGKPFLRYFCSENDENTMTEEMADAYWDRSTHVTLGNRIYMVVSYIPGEFLCFGLGDPGSSAITESYCH